MSSCHSQLDSVTGVDMPRHEIVNCKEDFDEPLRDFLLYCECCDFVINFQYPFHFINTLQQTITCRNPSDVKFDDELLLDA